MPKFLACCALITAWVWTLVVVAQTNDAIRLPELGDGHYSAMSLAQEYQLGRAWLMTFRRQAPIVADPLLQDYLEDLVHTLAAHSELKDKRLDVVIIDNDTMNAFAVPGGVIGVHQGLFLYAHTQAQLASVLAHELAHVSQRHYARSVEEQQRQMLPAVAGILAGVLLGATVGGDVGMATIAGTQAAAVQNQLRFSRQNEQEADRIGMQNLVRAGMDPAAVAAMFESMQQAHRYASSRPPEFLMTHPVTESRISDVRNRARQYPQKTYQDNPSYQLMRARVEYFTTNNSREAAALFTARLQASHQHSDADQYGLVLALTDHGEYEQANKLLAPLRQSNPHELAYLVAEAQLLMVAGDHASAIRLLEQGLSLMPDNHPLAMTLADALMNVGEPGRAEMILQAQAKRHPNNPVVWYRLAEAHGLAGNITGVHRARAEYFLLNGEFDRAAQQLRYALVRVKGDKLSTAKVQERIKQIQHIQVAVNAVTQ